jgi:glycosyltransferase involved in cell wall biosynthesis
MNIYYWSPHFGHIATINAVKNSAESLEKYSKNNYKTKIINAVGEWDNKNIDVSNLIYLSKKNYYSIFPKFGFFASRFFYFFVFIKCFFSLKKMLFDHKPDFIIIHLITSLPLLLLILFKFKTKFILRISGYPKLNFFRRYLWKLSSKKIFIVTAPSINTKNFLEQENVFAPNKIKILYDPVFKIREITKLKSEKNNFLFDKKKKYIFSAGRLSRQKNFKLLIDFFLEVKRVFKNYELIIAGEGEQEIFLKKLVKKYKLNNDVHFLGFVENIFKYLHLSECFISTSLWEDPGFVIVESGIANTNIICSDCPSGSRELLNNSNNGYLFENNNKLDLLKKFYQFIDDPIKLKKEKKVNAKIFFKRYSISSHFFQFNKILNMNSE